MSKGKDLRKLTKNGLKIKKKILMQMRVGGALWSSRNYELRVYTKKHCHFCQKYVLIFSVKNITILDFVSTVRLNISLTYSFEHLDPELSE